MSLDYFSLVPRDLKGNLEYRVAIRARAETDEAFRAAITTACKHDFLYFCSALAWCYEPRPRYDSAGNPLPKRLPFIPWDHQIPVMRQLRENLGRREVGIVKSRGEGMSWILVLLALHDWLFDPMCKIGLVSRSEEEADDPENSDSLFWKIDWALSVLPPWMGGKKGADWTRNVSKHSLKNERNGSMICADAATGSVFRGGRCKWAAFDEFAFFKPGEDEHALASSHGATDSRLFISTVNGTDNAFYRIMSEPSSMVQIEMDWFQNPVKNRGLYRFQDGRPVAVDPVNSPLSKHYSPPTEEIKDLYKRLKDKGFKLENKLRSPWYDEQCDRAGTTPHQIAQELDKDYGGAMARYFTPEFFDIARKCVQKPVTRGRMGWNEETLEPDFELDVSGNCLLWTKLDVKKRPPEGDYIIGCDVAAGLGGSYSSNSVASVIDRLTLEQVAELATNTIEPSDFAENCIALAKFFNNAELGWEHAGPGIAFTKHVISKGYGRIYKRDIHYKQSKKRTQNIGWVPTGDNREILFADLSREIRLGHVIPRSKDLVEEFGQYVRINGKIEHVLSVKTEDATSRGRAHGDRVMAFGVALQVARKRSKSGIATKEQRLSDRPPPFTMAARMKAAEDADKRNPDEWDDRTNWDLAYGDDLHAGAW